MNTLKNYEHKRTKLLWNEGNLKILNEWFPHFGTGYVSAKTGLSSKQVKSKADKMKINMLSKTNRWCINLCGNNQSKRRFGFYCQTCHLLKRKVDRRQNPRTTKQWIQELTNTARMRSKTPSDLTTEFMIELWENQKGMCHYSGLPMEVHSYGKGRSLFSPSIDRKDSDKGYTKDNVVWCAWICNAGKNLMSKEEYFKICLAVVYHNHLQN